MQPGPPTPSPRTPVSPLSLACGDSSSSSCPCPAAARPVTARIRTRTSTGTETGTGTGTGIRSLISGVGSRCGALRDGTGRRLRGLPGRQRVRESGRGKRRPCLTPPLPFIEAGGKVCRRPAPTGEPPPPPPAAGLEPAAPPAGRRRGRGVPGSAPGSRGEPCAVCVCVCVWEAPCAPPPWVPVVGA